MSNINKKFIQAQSGSAIVWIIIFLLLCSSFFAWYLFMQTSSDLEKTKKQKERIQQRYTQKSDELYDSWDKLQKLQNKQNQLSRQSELHDIKIKKLNNQLQLESEKEQQHIQELLLCTNKNKELAQKIKQLITQNEAKISGIKTKHQVRISTETNKYSQCQSSLELALLNIKKQEQQLISSKNLLDTGLSNTLELQHKVDFLNDNLNSHKKLFETSAAELEGIKKQLLKSQEMEKNYKNKIQMTTDLTKKLEQASANNLKIDNINKQLIIEREALQNYNQKLQDKLKIVTRDKKSIKNKPNQTKEASKN